jgi:hypothetical protein
MPWQSRIQSERTRRIALAVVMLLILGGSTALAAWMTDARRSPIAPGEPTHQFGPFSISLGTQWQPQRVDESDNPQWAQFVERGQTGRQLRVLVLESRVPRTPLAAIAEAAQQLSPSIQTVSAEIEQFDTRTLLVYAGQSLGQSNGQVIARKHALAVVTCDGQTYLALLLDGFGRIDRQHVDTIWQIAGSALDTRTQTTEQSTIRIGPVSLQRPSGVATSIGRADGAAAVWVGPAKAGRFYRLRLSYASLEEIGALLTQAGAENVDQATVEERISAFLSLVHQRVNGQPLPANQFQRVMVESQRVNIALISGGSAAALYRELWAVQIGDQGALLIDLRAEQSAAKLARYASQVLLAGLTVTPTGDTP